jgi:hypothetical protein
MGGFGLLSDQSQTAPPMETPEGLQRRLAEALQQQAPAPSGVWQSVPQANQYGRVTPDLPLEQKPDSSQNDPLGPLLSDLVTRYQATAEPPPAHGIKGLLQNFFTGGGNAMMQHVGLPTQADKRNDLLGQIYHLANARVLYQNTLTEGELRKAQIAAANRPLSPEQAAATGNPQLAGQIVPSDVMSAASAEQNRQLDAKQAAEAKAQNTPTISLPLDSGTAKLAGIPDSFVGKNLSVADWKLVDARLSAQGYSKQDFGFDGKEGGIWVIDRGGNKINQITPVSESNRATALMKAQLAANAPPKPGSLLVGTTQDGRQVAGTQEELQSAGVTNATKLGASEAEKTNVARQLTSSNGLFSMVDSDLSQFKPEELTTIGAHFNEFLTGRIGTGDTRYAALRTHMGLLSTALMQAHVGSRGSVQMMDHFKGLADAGKMNGDILKTSIKAERQYVDEKAMRPKGGFIDPFAQFGGKAR